MQLETLRKECEQYIQQDEDVLTYALFPQVATEFFKYREAQQTKMDAEVADTENGSYPVEKVDRKEVCVYTAAECRKMVLCSCFYWEDRGLNIPEAGFIMKQI